MIYCIANHLKQKPFWWFYFDIAPLLAKGLQNDLPQTVTHVFCAKRFLANETLQTDLTNVEVIVSFMHHETTVFVECVKVELVCLNADSSIFFSQSTKGFCHQEVRKRIFLLWFIFSSELRFSPFATMKYKKHNIHFTEYRSTFIP